jgi:hypothetical protein
MTTEFLIVFILGMLATGILAWDLAVHHHRHGLRLLTRRTKRIEADAAAFRAAEREDPQRAWLDAGKRSVISRVDATLGDIRRDLGDER